MIDVWGHRQWVIWHGIKAPVLDLAYETQAYERLGRAEKAAAIREALKRYEK